MSAPSSPVQSFKKYTLTVSVPEPVAPLSAVPAIVFTAEGPTPAVSPIGSANGGAAPAVPQIARHQLSVPSTAESSPALAAAAASVKQARRFFNRNVTLGGPAAGALENALLNFKITPLPSPYTIPHIELDGAAQGGDVDSGDEADDEHSAEVSAVVSPARAVHSEPVAQQS